MARPLSPEAIEDFRAALCAQAERLFAEQGYEGVTLRALAASLGCSPMTPYRYFANKEAIFTAVRTHAFVRFGERIRRAGARRSDPVARIRAFARAYVRFALDEPHAYRIMFELAKPAGLDAAMLADEARREELLGGWAPLVEAMRQGVASGRFSGDPLTLAHLAWSLLHGLVSLDLSGKLLLGRSLDDLVEPTVTRLLCALTVGAPQAADAPRLGPEGGAAGAAATRRAAPAKPPAPARRRRR